MKAFALLACAFLAAGCLGPSADDDTGYSSYVRERGASVPSLESDMVSALKVDANDGISGTDIPLHTGFAAGVAVRYWDFGTAQASAEPLWRFRKHVDGQPDQTVDHPDLIDSIPGDAGYSALRALYVVYVTAAYEGQRITSLRALDDAIELGLVEEPKALGKLTNCPVVLAATRLELGDGEPVIEPAPVYYRGQRATCFCLDSVLGADGDFMLPERGPIAAPNAYALQRQGEPVALDEAAYALDLTGNGDQLDTNVVFAVNAGAPHYTSLWTQVSVIVPALYAWGDSRAQSDLFHEATWGLEALTGKVEQVTPTTTVWNRPIRGVVP